MEIWQPLVGGTIIGGAAAALLLLTGRVAGVSGMVADVVPPTRRSGFGAWFLAGLAVGGALFWLVAPGRFAGVDRAWPLVVAAGVLVGAGTRLANGCTSGHGLCGVSRLAPRSLVATMTFMVVGALAVLVTK
jgi:uncharacterized membrane protein YedE/YeeE